MASVRSLRPHLWDDTSWTPYFLNQESCLSLDKITSSFSTPITEEHAWAIVFETVKCLKAIVEASHSRFYLITNTDQIHIHRDGHVHESTFFNGTDRVTASSEQKVVQELALVMYAALDTGLKENEERSLTPGLENLLGHMITAGEDFKDDTKVDTDDEGIEHDCDDCEQPRSCSSSSSGSSKDCLRKILGLCEGHLSVESEAEDHYRNVCRALVSEALELSLFLEKATSLEADHSEELAKLAIRDWANLWTQTLNELRQGVKLKKTDFTKTPIEYALTPYEILMDDIRSRRYKLNKVMVDGELPPKVKKDAHDIVLDFIRSRPPLKPANQRVLPPPRKYSTPQELLMESIRSDEARSKLRKTSGPPETPLQLGPWTGPLVVASKKNMNENIPKTSGDYHRSKSSMHRSNSMSSAAPINRVVIRPDPRYSRFNPEDEDDSEDEKEEIPTAPKKPPPSTTSSHHGHSRVYMRPRMSRLGSLSSLSAVAESPPSACAVSRPPCVLLSTPCGTILEEQNSNFAWSRRHSLHSQPQPLSVQGMGYGYNRPKQEFLQQPLPPRRRLSSQMVAGRWSSVEEGRPTASLRKVASPGLMASQQQLNRKKLASPAYVEALLNSQQPRYYRSPLATHASPYQHLAEKASPTLTLSHSELAHIRSTLSRAKLESLCLDSDLKAEIAKGNVCFHCTKTKFSIFFNRKHNCQLCQRNVCSKCISKVKLPEDQRFDNIPVFALSPNGLHQNQPVPKRSLQHDPSKVRLKRSNTIGRTDRPKSVCGDSPTGLLSSLSNNFGPGDSMTTLNVCLDCKQAVENIREKSHSGLLHHQNYHEEVPFEQRRRYSYHERRAAVTKSLIFD